ncbi:MAG: GspH/FimT family protein [Methylotenera sp.]|uniref:GspH/FimT family pseudopilin n=1 Tax=Methylotenera sp. TaxID=2051956 RepID=UPI002487E873|nr:GspH/FimT family protein [Methylotenera sp.]MDI1308767.1 GspH/FimT family protein [Methylotenera sp.]
MSMSRLLGFTLVELMVVIAIIAIMASIAVPSFSATIANMRAKNAASSIYDGLVRARSEAVKRNLTVTLAPATSWAQGWQITSSDSTTVLEKYTSTGTVTISGPTSVEYKSTGRAIGTGTFNISATSGSATTYRCVSVTLSGLPKIKASAC